jgi:aspartyl-tRNA(Asn)/glutamyl-tRNA(Gln) amidotransferase subunit A
MKLKDLSLEELLKLIESWDKTSEEIYEYFTKRIEKYDEKLGSFLVTDFNGFKKWQENTLLKGLPISLKDIFSKKWTITSWASKMLENFETPFTSTVVERLEKEGMSYVWKNNMDEFAMWGSGEKSAFKNTLNPWGTDRIPGGSSSGWAAAVAAWLVPASLWTDTGWSVRQPASLCGIVWFKPTYGRNSRFWVHAMASSLDCPATFTKTVKDSALLYNIMNWQDEKDMTSIQEKDNISEEVFSKEDLKWKKIWVPKEYFEEGLEENVKIEIQNAIKKMEELWAEIKEISLPMTKYWVTTYYILMPAEVTTNLARLDWLRYGYNSEKEYSNVDEMYQNNRWEGLWEEVKRRIIIWNYVLSAGFYDAYYKKASQIRTLIIKDFDKAFEEVDAIVSPVSPEAAWKIWTKSTDPLKMYMADAYTIPASLAWLPWISVPCGFVEEDGEKLPVWIQILTQRLNEKELFEIANVYEKAVDLRNEMIPEGFED